MTLTYQQTVTIVQLAEDCVPYILIAVGRHFKSKYLKITHSPNMPEQHGRITIGDIEGEKYEFDLDGDYLAITDNHCWVLTPDELDSEDVKET